MLALERPAEGSREAEAGAAYVLRATQCGMAVEKAVAARAEGVVHGERRTEKVTLVPTSQPGVYLVRRDWPSNGTWTLVFSIDNHGHATLLASATPSGPIASRLLHRPATKADLDAAVKGRLDSI